MTPYITIDPLPSEMASVEDHGEEPFRNKNLKDEIPSMLTVGEWRIPFQSESQLRRSQPWSPQNRV